jgi:predicted nucleic acid-binding protein
MLSELRSREGFSSVEIHPVSSHIIQNTIKIVLEQHICIIDAIQRETCIDTGSTVFCSADRELNATARKLGIETTL